MKVFLLFSLFALVLFGGTAIAQDLDTVTVSDQFDSGHRGNDTTTWGNAGNYMSTNPDGSEAVTITDTAGATGAISYVNTFAGGSGTGDTVNGESPVKNVVTSNMHPDRNTTRPNITGNSRPGATSPDSALLVCDDGGFNAIFWGQKDDQNYFVQSDVYCYDRSTLLTTQYEAASVCIRAASRSGGWVEYTFNMDRSGSYALVYDEILRTIEAVKWTYGNSSAAVISRVAPPTNRTVYGTLTSVAAGWHTFKVAADGDNIKFWVDGSLLADVVDSSSPYTSGYAGLVLRESGITGSSEYPAIFDNMSSGPYQNTPTPTPTFTETPTFTITPTATDTFTPSTEVKSFEVYE